MQSSEYLEKSERTLAVPEELGRTFIKSDKDILGNNLGFVFAGIQADFMKRTMFYKTPYDTEKHVKAHQDVEELLKKVSELDAEFKLTTSEINLVHAMLGIVSEVGEIMEELIKSKVENRELNLKNLKEEVGDIEWYVAIMIRHLKLTHEDIFASNIAKLSVRYPDKFTTEAAENRDLVKEEQAVVETNA